MEVNRLQHLILQILWHSLACLIVLSKVGKYLGHSSKVLIELAWHLYEVAEHVGATEGLVLYIR